MLQALRNGELREPERLMGFVRTIVHRQIAGYIKQVVRRRGREDTDGDHAVDSALDARRNPEQACAFAEKVKVMKQVLREMPDREREVLVRFYVYEHSQARICADLELSDTQFRLVKSRAKDRAAALTRRGQRRRNLLALVRG